MKPYIHILTVLLLTVLAACSPQFREFKTYIPPAKNKTNCVVKAQRKHSSCAVQALSSYRNCINEQTIVAQPSFNAAQIEYMAQLNTYNLCRQNTLNQYNRTIDNYNRCVQVATLAQKSVQALCGNSPLSTPSIQQQCGNSPRSPRIDQFINKGVCGSAKGNCDAEYDANYQACGGTILKETRCVANCSD